MWQTKYASAVTINLELGFDFRLSSEGDFLTGRPKSVLNSIKFLIGRFFQKLCSSQNVQTLFPSVLEEGEKFQFCTNIYHI